jgi:hypothetical protein
MTPQASKKRGLLPLDHQRISSCTSNSINSEQVSGPFSVLTIASLSTASAQSKKRFPDTIFHPRFEVTEDGKKYSTRWKQ